MTLRSVGTARDARRFAPDPQTHGAMSTDERLGRKEETVESRDRNGLFLDEVMRATFGGWGGSGGGRGGREGEPGWRGWRALVSAHSCSREEER